MKQPAFIFITGGVVSSLGKGIIAASLGRLLKNRGLKVGIQKLDPYINVDSGTLSPYQHGEIYVTADGKECDLDLGHYERFIDETLDKNADLTAGNIYQDVIRRERSGEFLGKTIQVIPHITDAIKENILRAAESSGADVLIVEIGGTVGDIESLPFLEAIRQFRKDVGDVRTLYLHTTLVPYLEAAKELKTKPTQHSVKELRSLGIHPDIIVLRTKQALGDAIREKIADFCDVEKSHVIEAHDQSSIYAVPISLKKEGLDDRVDKKLGLDTAPPEMGEWQAMVERMEKPEREVTIGLVGKYARFEDAYLSISEAFVHAGGDLKTHVNLRFIDTGSFDMQAPGDALSDVHGILVPGGFGPRGAEEKIAAVKYARENNIPFFGICYGMQLAIVESARNLAGLEHANTIEADPKTPHPVVRLEHGQEETSAFGGTLFLGEDACAFTSSSRIEAIYEKSDIEERHRHRYIFNLDYQHTLEKAGIIFSGKHPARGDIKAIERDDHPFFIAVQYHPEFLSRPNAPHPLFREFISHALSQE